MKRHWIGETVGGRYQIEEKLGQGGMSSVYKAMDPNLKRIVAIKMIHPHLSDSPEFIQRFETEAAAVAQLRHVNIVKVFDFNHDEDVYFMVLEFIPGETLQSRLKHLAGKNRMLSQEEIVRFGSGIADAVDYAHKRGMIHRDIKPANIMLDFSSNAILTDFGIAKIVGEQHFTATGAVLGTAMYMSPEQIEGKPVDHRTDIYSLGVLLFEMVCGHPPYEADSAISVMRMHIQDPIPDLSGINPDTPNWLRAVIEKALAKDPTDRFNSAGEMRNALRDRNLELPAAALMTSAQTVIDTPDVDSLEPVNSDLSQTILDDEDTAPGVDELSESDPGEKTVIDDRAEDISAGAVAAAAAGAATFSEGLPDDSETDPGTLELPDPANATILDEPEIAPPVADASAGQAISEKAETDAGLEPPDPAQATILDEPEVVPPVADASTGQAIPEEAETDPGLETPEATQIENATVVEAASLAPQSGEATFLEDPSATPPAGLAASQATMLEGEPASTVAEPVPLPEPEPAGKPTLLSRIPAWSWIVLGVIILGVLIIITQPWTLIGGGTEEPVPEVVTTVELAATEEIVLPPTETLPPPPTEAPTLEPMDALAELVPISALNAGELAQVGILGKGALISSALSPELQNLALTGSLGVWVHDLDNPMEPLHLDTHTDRVGSASFSPDGTQLASASDDRTVRIWDPTDGQELHILQGHERRVISVAWSPEGEYLVSGGLNGDIRLWDPESGQQLDQFSINAFPVRGMAWSPTNSEIAWGSSDGFIWIQELEGTRPSERRSLRGHSGNVMRVYWSADGTQLASLGEDGTARVWDAATGAELSSTSGSGNWVEALAFDPAEAVLTTSAGQGQTTVTNLVGGNDLLTVGGFFRDWISKVAWLSDGEQVAAGSLDGTLRTWESGSGNERAVITNPDGPITSLGAQKLALVMAIGSADGSWGLWEEGGGWENTLVGENLGAAIVDMDWSPDDRYLAQAGGDGLVVVWDTQTDSVKSFGSHRDTVTGVTWSPMADQLASASADSTVRIWTPAESNESTAITGHSDAVLALDWSRDGLALLTASADGMIRVWEPVEGRLVLTIEDGDRLQDVGWSPDSSLIVSASTDGNDGIIRVWDAEDGTLLQELLGTRSVVTSLAWNADGSVLASGGREGAVRLWGIEVNQ